jgi:ATP-dependent Lon protease
VLIPEENAKDLAEIPDNVKNELDIIPVSRMSEVLDHALTDKLTPIEWSEPVGTPVVADDPGQESGTSIAH